MPRRSRTQGCGILALFLFVLLFVFHRHRPFLPHPAKVRDHAKDLLQSQFSVDAKVSTPYGGPTDRRIHADAQSPIGATQVDQSPDSVKGDSHSALQAKGEPIYIFAFGDSYTTYNFETSLTPPSPTNPQGNRAPSKLSDCPEGQQLSTCTFKWLDYILTDAKFPSVSPSPTFLAWNFGRGASTIDPDLVPPNFWGAKSLVDQSKEFLSTVNDRAHSQHVPWSANNSLVIIFFGINDVANTAEATALDHNALYTRILGTYAEVLEELYEAGARNYILMNLPPLDRTPMLLQAGPPHTHAIAGATAMFNKLLEGLAVDDKGGRGLFAARRTDARIKVVDTQPIFHKALDAEPEFAKCSVSERNECLWVDLFHPGEKIQRAMGTEIGRVIEEMLTP